MTTGRMFALLLPSSHDRSGHEGGALDAACEHEEEHSAHGVGIG